MWVHPGLRCMAATKRDGSSLSSIQKGVMSAISSHTLHELSASSRQSVTPGSAPELQLRIQNACVSTLTPLNGGC